MVFFVFVLCSVRTTILRCPPDASRHSILHSPNNIRFYCLLQLSRHPWTNEISSWEYLHSLPLRRKIWNYEQAIIVQSVCPTQTHCDSVAGKGRGDVENIGRMTMLMTRWILADSCASMDVWCIHCHFHLIQCVHIFLSISRRPSTYCVFIL